MQRNYSTCTGKKHLRSISVHNTIVYNTCKIYTHDRICHHLITKVYVSMMGTIGIHLTRNPKQWMNTRRQLNTEWSEEKQNSASLDHAILILATWRQFFLLNVQLRTKWY